MDLYLAHRMGAGESDAEFLAQHEDLREILQPLLEEGEGAEETTRPVAGRYLGDFRLVREIGRGGMGVVFEAEQVSLGRRVALKVLPAHLTLAPRQIERFRREAAAAARLEHPGIVPVHGVGEADGSHFYAMELVDGSSLQERLSQRDGAPAIGVVPGASAAAAAATIAAQVAEALAFAHEHGVIHRDVKPQNILIDTEGRARLVDFGLAKQLDTDSLSGSGEFAGTPFYMSPEQAAGKGTVDGRTDVFSLGVVLYEMLAGARPFVGDTTQQVLLAITGREPRALRRLDARVPRDLETVCMKALEKSPGARYPSAESFAADLRRFLNYEPIEVRPAGAATRFIKLVRRHRALAGALALALAVALTSGILLWLQSVEQSRANEEHLTLSRAAVTDLIELATKSELPRQPGKETDFLRLLANATTMCEELLSRERVSPPGFVQQVALLWSRAGVFFLELGKRGRAEKAFARAIDLGRSALGRMQGEAAHRCTISLAIALNNRFVVRGFDYQHNARADYDESVVGLTRVIAETTDAVLAKRAKTVLATAWTNHGTMLTHLRGQAREGRRCLLRAVELWKEAGPESMRTAEYGAGYAWTLIRLSGAHRQCQGHDAALAAADAAIAHVTPLLRERPRDRALRSADAYARTVRAEALRSLGRLADEAVQLDEAMAVVQSVVRDFPTDGTNAVHLTRVEFLRAVSFIDARRFKEALGLLERAAERGLAIASFEAERVYAMVLAHRAFVWSRRRGADMAAVDREFADAIGRLRELVRRRPANVSARTCLAGTLCNQGICWIDRGDAERAVGLLNDAIEHQLYAVTDDPPPLGARKFFQVQIGMLVRALSSLGRHAAIVEAARTLSRSAPTATNHARAAWFVCKAIAVLDGDGARDGDGRARLAERYGDEAMRFLRTAVESGFTATAAIATTPALRPLHARPDFQQLVRKLGG